MKEILPNKRSQRRKIKIKKTKNTKGKSIRDPHLAKSGIFVIRKVDKPWTSDQEAL